MRQRRTPSRLVLATLAVLLGLPTTAKPAFGAAGDWGRVQRLKPDSRIVVTTLERESFSGRLVAAGPDGVTVRTMGEDRAFPRAEVLEVVHLRTRSNVALVAAAAAVGVVISSAFVYACGQEPASCAGVGSGALVFVVGAPVVFGGAAHRATRKETATVVYRRPAVRPGG
jgi:hypothetical protein